MQTIKGFTVALYGKSGKKARNVATAATYEEAEKITTGLNKAIGCTFCEFGFRPPESGLCFMFDAVYVKSEKKYERGGITI
jgi:hypothetical protein